MSVPSSPSSSDRDDTLDEDMEALRRACMLTGAGPSGVGDSDTDSDSADDIGYLHRLQERFSEPHASTSAPLPPIIRPLSARPMPDSDEEDDFEILRAIRRRFAQYESDAIKRKSENCFEEAGVAVANVTTGRETPDILSKCRKCTALSEECPDSDIAELHHAEDETCDIYMKALTNSQFPKAAQNFVDALRKNRSCQKFMRRKLIEIEAKIEENKELRERIKCLMDFQVVCKRKMGRILCQEKDPRIRLITTRRPNTTNTPKVRWKKFPALCFGPDENSHVSKYKMVMRRFPFALRKLAWSNIENEKLAKGIKQQYQEMLILNSMNFESGFESTIGSNLVPGLSSSDLEVTPDKIRTFLPLVDWDRLASMYLNGRSGAECESRWLNFEDPMVNHNPWTMAEDKKLLYIVQERGVYNWIDIAMTLGTHITPFQCLARYQRSLNPHILNKDWTGEEDARLRTAVENFGPDWQVVASNVEGRSGPQCSNRWRKSLHPDRRKVGRWSVDEDKRLKVAVMLFGAKNWSKIAQFVPGRTQVQCRERWLNCLDPSLSLEPWTEEEDAKLLAAISEHGYSWSKVASCVSQRTDSQCRRRWTVLLPHEVPMLQAVKKMKRTVLICNFVDRENERPLIGPNDFSPLVLSNVAEDGNNKTSEKKKSSDPPKKCRSRSKRSLKENLKADDIVNPSLGISPGDSSLVPGANSAVAKSGSMKRTRKKTSSNNQAKNSRAKSRRSLKEKLTADGVNSSSGTAPGDLSRVPGVSSTAESEKMKMTRRKKSSGRGRSRRSLEANSAEGGTINSSKIAPAELSVVPIANLSSAEKGSLKRTRKRTSREGPKAKIQRVSRSDSSEPTHSIKCEAKDKHCKEHKVAEILTNYQATENTRIENSPEAGLEPPAVDNKSRKRTRTTTSREGSVVSNQHQTSCNDSGPFHSNKSKAKRHSFPRQCLTNDVILTSNDSSAMEKKGSDKLVSRGGISNQLAEEDKVVQIHPEHALTNIMGSCATLDGTSDTAGVSLANIVNDICHDGTNLAADADYLLPDSTSQNKAKWKQECLDSEVAGVMNSSENNV